MRTNYAAAVAAALLYTTIGVVSADTPTNSGKPANQPKPAKKQSIVVFGSIRERLESWDWFGTHTGNDSYGFYGSLLRVGATAQSRGFDATVELAQPTLLGLPTHATGSAAQGLLGQGGTYYKVNGNANGSLFVKQAFIRVRNPAHPADQAKAGRFEFFDGTEATAPDPTIGWLKANRVAQRLIGNFGYTTVQRSFDGAQAGYASGSVALTAFGGDPTRGVFDLDGNTDISRVNVDYLALTPSPSRAKAGTDARFFAIYYDDSRMATVKVDNRPSGVRTADTAPIRIETFGGDYLRVMRAGSGKLDVMAWGAVQAGKWGELNQQAYAFDAEAGWQPRKAASNPWLRGGYSYFSGDGNAGDNTHGTFFPMLPTTRIYARFPFFTESNLTDAYAELLLRPSVKTTIRTGIHDLSLANSHDLWYQGGGAFETTGNFGYTGLTSSNAIALATLIDASIDYKADKVTTWTGYVGAAVPGTVIKTLYDNRTATMAYIEYNRTF